MIENLNDQEIEKVLINNYIGRIGCCDDETPHVIPTTYYYDPKTKSIISHTREGMKTKIFRKHPRICLEVEEIENLNNWKSVVVYGVYEELTGITARNALHAFVENTKTKINLDQSTNVSYVSEISHSTHPDNQAIVYRINPTRVAGKFEREMNDILSN